MQPVDQQGDQQKRSFIEEARRAQIVASAIDVVAEVGYPQASMARIAAHAGISRGLISYHFANKAELLTEVITSVYIDGAQFMGPQIAEQTDAPSQLRMYITANLEYMRAHPNRMLALVDIFTSAGRDELSGLGEQDNDAALGPLEEIFHNGQSAGEFRDFDVRTMAHAVRNVIDGVPPRLSEPGFDIDAAIGELTTLFELAVRGEGPFDRRSP